MHVNPQAGSVAITAYANLFSGATLTLYDGTIPANSSTAISTQKPLASFVFASPAFSGSPGSDILNGAFVSPVAEPVNNGLATWARAILSASPWAATTAYARGALVTSGGGLWVAVVPGTSSTTGPTVPAYAAHDGSVYWDYVGPGSTSVLADFDVGATGSSSNIILDATVILIGVDVVLAGFTLQVKVG